MICFPGPPLDSRTLPLNTFQWNYILLTCSCAYTKYIPCNCLKVLQVPAFEHLRLIFLVFDMCFNVTRREKYISNPSNTGRCASGYRQGFRNKLNTNKKSRLTHILLLSLYEHTGAFVIHPLDPN